MPLKVWVTQNSMLYSIREAEALGDLLLPSAPCSRKRERGWVASNFSEEARHGVPARSDFLFSDRRSARASPAKGCSGRGLDNRQRREMGHSRSDAAHGAPTAERRASHPRRPQLRLV